MKVRALSTFQLKINLIDMWWLKGEVKTLNSSSITDRQIIDALTKPGSPFRPFIKIEGAGVEELNLPFYGETKYPEESKVESKPSLYLESEILNTIRAEEAEKINNLSRNLRREDLIENKSELNETETETETEKLQVIEEKITEEIIEKIPVIEELDTTEVEDFKELESNSTNTEAVSIPSVSTSEVSISRTLTKKDYLRRKKELDNTHHSKLRVIATTYDLVYTEKSLIIKEILEKEFPNIPG